MIARIKERIRRMLGRNHEDDSAGPDEQPRVAGPRATNPDPVLKTAIKPAGNFRPRLIVEMADFNTLSAAQVRVLMRAFEFKDITLADLDPHIKPGGGLAGLLPWDQLRSELGAGCRFGRLRNGLNLALLRELEERAHDMALLYAPLRYFSLEPPAGVTATARTNALAQLNLPANQTTFGISRAYEEVAVPYLPSVPKLPADAKQTFLKAATAGINAEAAWTEPGGYGHDVRFVDIEYSWYLEHPDLPDVETIYEDDFTYTYTDPANPENVVQDHGTAMLGIVVAQHNNVNDAFGIAPAAEAYVLSSLLSDATHDLPGTILQACISVVRPGDVLLIEGQVELDINGVPTLLPAEVERAVFDAIRFAVNLGVIVIEPAGNFDGDLDQLNGVALGYPAGAPLAVNLLHRTGPNWDPDLMDSGAVMVGAGQENPAGGPIPYEKWRNSNFGSRIDCFAHGDRVWSLSNRRGSPYRSEEGGTSAAAAIVAAVAVVMQSIFKDRNGEANVLSAARVRELLSQSGTPSSGSIGVLPDLARLVPAVKSEPIATPPPKPPMPQSLKDAFSGPVATGGIPRLSTPR